MAFRQSTLISNYKVQRLRKINFGYLWIVFYFMGIDIFKISFKLKCINVNCSTVQKYLFPMTITCNAAYILYLTWNTSPILSYETLLNTTMTILPNVIWLTVFLQKRSLRTFLLHVVTISKSLSEENNFLANITNTFLFITFSFPIVIASLEWNKRKKGIPAQEYNIETHIRKLIEQTWIIWHQLTIPAIVAILYVCISYCLIRQLRFCKRQFKKLQVDTSSKVVESLLKWYLEIVKCVEEFQNVSSSFVFCILWQYFCVVSFGVMELMYYRIKDTLLMVEVVLYIFHSSCVIGVVTVFAAEIPLELQQIRIVLFDVYFGRFHCKGKLKDCLDTILKKEPPVLSACNIFVFERSFILKALGGIVGQAVLLYGIMQ